MLIVPLLLFLLLTSTACLKQKTARVPGAKAGGTLNYFLGEPVAIDPAFVQEGEGIKVARELFDGLVDYDPKSLAVKPAVAVRWRANRAGDEWTFWLRQGVKFHNGRGVKARDFIYAWDRVAGKATASPAAYHLAAIKGFGAVQKGKTGHLTGLTASGDYVLKVKLSYPFAEFPAILGHPVFSPVPKEEVKKSARRFGDRPVGNGPFAMAEPWKHERGITVKRFDDYYGRLPHLDQVYFKIIDNQQTAFLELNGGGLDWAPIPPGQLKATVRQFGSDAVVGQPQLVLNFYGFNLRGKPFKNNAKLRRAINYAVNRRAIVANVYENAYVPAGTIVPPGIKGYKSPPGAYSYSPSRARRLLKEAGYPGGKRLPAIKLIYNTGRGHEEPAQVVQENLREIGVALELEGLEMGAFINALRSGDMDMFAVSWQADYPTPDSFLYQLFHSESGDNVLGFADAKVDRLLARARQEPTAADRYRLYAEAEARILQAAPVIPYAYVGTGLAHGRRVKGFVRTGMDDTPLDRVWIIKD